MTPPSPHLCYCPACGCPGIIWERSGNSFHALIWSDGLMTGPMLPDEAALLIHPVCRHYIWHDELAYSLPESLTLEGCKAGEQGVQTCLPHETYLVCREYPDDWNLSIGFFKYWDTFSESRHEVFDRMEFFFRLHSDVVFSPPYELVSVESQADWETAWQAGVGATACRGFLLRHWWWSINHPEVVWNQETQEYEEPPPRDFEALERCLKELLPVLEQEGAKLDQTEALRQLGQLDEARACYRRIDPKSLTVQKKVQGENDEDWYEEHRDDSPRYKLIGSLLDAGRLDVDCVESKGFSIYL